MKKQAKLKEILLFSVNPNSSQVIIIQKKTSLERSLAPLEIAENSLQKAHDDHHRVLDKVISFLDNTKINYTLLSIDQVLLYPFFQGSNGFKVPVIALGGDGTLLHASHYVGSNVPLLGIKSSEDHSVGHLCAGSESNLEKSISFLMGEQSSTFKKSYLSRLSLHNQREELILPCALNDILFCHQHPAATSRYHVCINDLYSQKHKSSGIWFSTAAGSSAAVSSYGHPLLSLTDPSFYMVVRELYSPREADSFFKGQGSDFIFVKSHMNHGMVSVDGHDWSLKLGFYDSFTVRSLNENRLCLVTSDDQLA